MTDREAALEKILREIIDVHDATVTDAEAIIDVDGPLERRWRDAIAAARRATGLAERGAA